MARNQRKPSERSSKKDSLKVNVKGSGAVKKQSKVVTKVSKTKAKIKCSKCSKFISGNNTKVKVCASCLKSIATLSKKKNPAPAPKPQPLQISKIKVPTRKTSARESVPSSKNNLATTSRLSNSMSVKSPSKTFKSRKATPIKSKSRDNEKIPKNKSHTSVDAPKSNSSLEAKMGLRGKKRSYVQLAGGFSDEENQTKKKKTATTVISSVRGTRNKKPTPKASEWLNTISPKRKSTPKEISKVEIKSKSPKRKSISKTPSNSRKSNSPSKTNSGQKKNTPSSASKKSVKRLSNIQADIKKPSPPAKNKANTIPPTTKSRSSTRGSTRQSAKFTSDSKVTVQKKTRSSSAKPLSRVGKKDNISVKANNTDLKDTVLFAKEILEDILISVANDSEISLLTDTNSFKEDLNTCTDSTITLENNVIECVDDLNGKELQFSVPTCEEGRDGGTPEDIELHLSPDTVEPEMDISDYQDKDKVHEGIEENLEVVDSLKFTQRENQEIESSKVDNKSCESSENYEPRETTSKTCLFDDGDKTIQGSMPVSADDKPHDSKLEPTGDGLSKSLSHHSSENICEITNLCSESKNDILTVVSSPSSDKLSQNNTQFNADFSHPLPILDSPKHIAPQSENNQSYSLVSASEATNNFSESSKQQCIDGISENQYISNQTVNKKGPEETLNSTDKKTLAHKYLPEQNNSFGSLVKHCAENNLSSNGHEGNVYCKANSTEDANLFSQSQSLCSNVSPNVHSTTYVSTLKSSPISTLKEKSKSLHIQDTFALESAIHCPATTNLDQINAEVRLSATSKCHSGQGVLTNKNENTHIENKDDESMQYDTIHCTEVESISHDISSTVKNDRFVESKFNKCNENASLVQKNSDKHINCQLMMKNSDDCKTDGEVLSLMTDSNHPNTSKYEESVSTDYDDRKVGNDKVLPTPNSHVNENQNNEESSLKYDKFKMETRQSTGNMEVHDGEGFMTENNAELPTKDGDDYTNENNDEQVANDSHTCKTDRDNLLSPKSVEDHKNQTVDILLTNGSEKSDDCKNESDSLLSINDSDVCKASAELLPAREFEDGKNATDEGLSTKDSYCYKNSSDELLPTKEFENGINENDQKLPAKAYIVLKSDTDKQLLTSESDGLKSEVNGNKIIDVDPLTVDYDQKCNRFSEPVKNDFEDHDVDKITSVMRDDIYEQANKTEQEPSKQNEQSPLIEECKTAQSDQSGIFTNQIETKPGEDKPEEEPVSEKEQSPQIEEYKTTQSDQSGIFTNQIETKLGEVKPEEEPVSEKEQSPQIEEYKTTQSDQIGIFTNQIETKPGEDKPEEETVCEKEQSPQIEEFNTTQSDQSGIFTNQIETKPGEDKPEEEPVCEKEQSPQIEEYTTSQSDQREICSSLIEIKTDEENANTLLPNSEVLVLRTESPMNVDNKTDFENNDNCDEVTLKIEETREDCISIDGTDVESMQCNSETRSSSHRMSVDEEVITMDIDQDDTAVDGSDCQNFGIKVGNELNMEVN